MMACRLADWSAHSQATQDHFAALPLAPGWVSDTCGICVREVHVGVNQFAELQRAPQEYEVVCLVCALLATKLSEAVTGQSPVIRDFGSTSP